MGRYGCPKEKHDILLMKAVRAAMRDEEVLQEMHETEPFNLETIVERYNAEMVQVIGDHKFLDQQISSSRSCSAASAFAVSENGSS
jgi:PleD family two-component response regulator